MERDTPSLFLSKVTKAARTGRIYLDYLRNERALLLLRRSLSEHVWEFQPLCH